ncbi:hypothetical protein GN958_ATG14257 [Phytophthora infestans]|nr:hypothetical protein GN958_ATG14257 [Phytophthora infestans]
MEVKPFRGGGRKTGLEFQLRLNRVYGFLGLDESADSIRDLREVITQLLSGNVLDEFNEQYDEILYDEEPSMETIVTAMESFTRRYCPPWTREMLHEAIRSLRETRSLSVGGRIWSTAQPFVALAILGTPG